MANAYSTAVAYNEYISPVNLSLVNTVLASKEQKYNANMAKIDSVLESYGNMDFYRDEDKQMMYENINVMLDSMQGLDKMALSNSDTIRNINNSFKNAVTPYLQQQLVNTAKIRSTFSHINELKQKGDEAYNEGNVSYMLHNAGFEQYANGETDSVGDMNYIPYYNLDKAVMEEIKVWAKDFGVSERIVEEMVNHGGTTYAIQQISKETLSPESVKNMVYNKLRRDPRAMQQVDINSWNQYSGMNDEEFTTTYRTTAKTAEKSYQESIAKIDAQLKTAIPNTERHAVLTAQREEAVLNRDSYKKIADSTEPLNRRAVERQIYIDQFASGYAQTYSFERVTDIKYDKLPIEIMKEKRAEEKHELEIKKLRNELEGEYNAGGVGGNVIGTPVSQGIPQNQEEVEELYRKTSQDREIKYNKYKELLAQTDPTYQQLTTEAERDKYAETLLDESYDSELAIDGASGKIVAPHQDVANIIQEIKGIDENIKSYTNVTIKQTDEMAKKFYEATRTSYHDGAGDFRNITLEDMRNFKESRTQIQKNTPWDNLSDLEKASIKKEYLHRLDTDMAGSYDKEIESILSVANKANERVLASKGGYKHEWDEYDTSGGWGQAIGKRTTSVLNLVGGYIGAGLETIAGNIRNEIEGVGIDPNLLGRNIAKNKTIQAGRRHGETATRAAENIWRTSEGLQDLSLAEVDMSTGRNVYEETRRQLEGLKADATSSLAINSPTSTASDRISINTASTNKLEKKASEDLTNLVSAYKTVGGEDGSTIRGWVVPKDAVIDYKMSADNKSVIISTTAQRSYVNSEGTRKNMMDSQDVEVPVGQVPKYLLDNIGTRKAKWNYSLNNPNRVTPKFEYASAPTTVEASDKLKKNIYNLVAPPTATREEQVQYLKIAEMGSRQPSEWLEPYSGYLTTEGKKNMAENLVNSKFIVTFDGSEETGYLPKVTITYPNGKSETVNINSQNIDVSVVDSVRGRTSSGILAINEAVNQKLIRIIQEEDNAR